MNNINSKCYICEKGLYRNKSDLTKYKKHFCSKECRQKYNKSMRLKKICPICNNKFFAKKKSKFCSRSCSNSNRKGIKYLKLGFLNSSQKKHELLKNTFGASSCMIDGCEYNIVLDVHRLIPGKEGGKYVLGNMFLICPNHHAEVTRGIIELEKINDYTLKIRK